MPNQGNNNDNSRIVTGLAVGAGLATAGYMLYNWLSGESKNRTAAPHAGGKTHNMEWRETWMNNCK